MIRTKPHAFLHYGGQVAAPVFREIATKLYAMYVEKKDAPNYVTTKDSSGYFYAGYTKDIKNIFSKLDVSYKDSTTQNNWSSVYAKNAVPVIKGTNVTGKVYAQCKRYGFQRCIVFA